MIFSSPLIENGYSRCILRRINVSSFSNKILRSLQVLIVMGITGNFLALNIKKVEMIEALKCGKFNSILMSKCQHICKMNKMYGTHSLSVVAVFILVEDLNLCFLFVSVTEFFWEQIDLRDSQNKTRNISISTKQWFRNSVKHHDH